MTNKRAVQAFLATSTLFLTMSGMNAWAQDVNTPAASVQAPVVATAPAAPQSDARAGKPSHHGGFKVIDTNGDGQVLRDEAKGHARLEKNSDQIDTSYDGQLSKDGPAAWHRAHKGEMHEKMAQRFNAKFKAADKDNNGSLTKDEVQIGMSRLAKNFDQIDANRDGKITEDEIHAYMKARHDARKVQKNTPAIAAIPGGSSVTKDG